MDPDEIREDSLTSEEVQDVKSSEMDAEEAHRYEEFRDLRDILENVREEIRNGFEAMKNDIDGIRAGMGVFVDGGAVVNDTAVNDLDTVLETAAAIDVDGDGDDDVIVDFNDLDLS